MKWLPTADTTTDNNGTGGTFTTTKDPKGVLHTTETSSWPDYSGFTIAPHATILPVPGKGIKIRQHVPFTKSAMALHNLSGGVETNRDYAFQFELVGTCDEETHVKTGRFWWAQADDVVLLALYDEVIMPVSEAFGIPLVAKEFQSYPQSYGLRGATNTVRMSGANWDSFSGWCGHQHVPENVHGDPGSFPWKRMMQLVADRETDVPLTDAEIDKIADRVWARDRVPAWSGDLAANPTWSGENAVNRLGDQLNELTALVKTMALAVTVAQNKADAAAQTATAAKAVVDTLKVAIATLPAAAQTAVVTALKDTAVDVTVNINGKAPQ